MGTDWPWLSMDGCLTKAPLGEKKRPGETVLDRREQWREDALS
jgi:hypothetical protein